MDNSIKELLVQETKAEITKKIEKCNDIYESFRLQLPEYFSEVKKQYFYMCLSLIALVVIVIYAFANSEFLPVRYNVSAEFFYAVFISFSVYAFFAFLFFFRRTQQIKKVKSYRKTVEQLKDRLKKDLSSVDKTIRYIDACFKDEETFTVLQDNDIDEKIEHLDNKAKLYKYDSMDWMNFVILVLGYISVICFNVLCLKYFSLEGNASQTIVINIIVDIILLIAVNGIILFRFKNRNFMSFVAGLICPFLSLAICFVLYAAYMISIGWVFELFKPLF